MEEKLACESIRFFWALGFSFFFCMKQEQKKTCPCTLKKKTSDSIEPRVYELGAIQPEVRYFRTSNRISPGSLVSRTLVKGKKTLGTSLLAFQWKPPTSLSARTICDITGDFDLIWYSVRVYRPVRNFSNFDLQVWFVILDKQLYWGFIHNTPEKFENAALFLRLGLPSSIIRHENGRSSNENTVQTRGIWKRRLCV